MRAASGGISLPAVIPAMVLGHPVQADHPDRVRGQGDQGGRGQHQPAGSMLCLEPPCWVGKPGGKCCHPAQADHGNGGGKPNFSEMDSEGDWDHPEHPRQVAGQGGQACQGGRSAVANTVASTRQDDQGTARSWPSAP